MGNQLWEGAIRKGMEPVLSLRLETSVDPPGRAVGASSSGARDQDGLD